MKFRAISISVLFCVLLGAFFAVGVIAPKDEKASERENRELKAMPVLNSEALFSGSFSKDFEDYLADNVGYRSTFMSYSSAFDSFKGIKTDSGKIVTVAKDLGVGTEGENKLLVLKDRVMEIYKKDNEARNSYIKMLDFYAKELPEDIRIFNMLVPTQIEFYKDKTIADSQKETIDYIYSNTDKRVKKINAYDILSQHSNEYIYFRTDHHWTQRGAFYAYTSFSQTANGFVPDINDYTVNSREGFLGYLYNQANDNTLEKYADTIEWYVKGENEEVNARAFENGEYVEYTTHIYSVPPEDEAVKYGLFMGGDHQFAQINTHNKNGKTLLVIKDSYANALLPFLCADYETILIIDPRSYYGTISELCQSYEVDDCLFINYVFTTTFDDFIAKMMEIK